VWGHVLERVVFKLFQRTHLHRCCPVLVHGWLARTHCTIYTLVLAVLTPAAQVPLKIRMREGDGSTYVENLASRDVGSMQVRKHR